MATVAKSPTVLLSGGTAMSQSAVLLGALFAGFIIFLMLQGKLGSYWSLMTGGIAGATASSSTGTSTSTGAPIVPGTQTPGTPGLATNPFAGLPSGLFSGPNPFFANPFTPGGSFGPPATTTSPATTPAAPAIGGH